MPQPLTTQQCYKFQNELIKRLDSGISDNLELATVAKAWIEIVKMQRILRGVPPIKAESSRLHLRRVEMVERRAIKRANNGKSSQNGAISLMLPSDVIVDAVVNEPPAVEPYVPAPGVIDLQPPAGGTIDPKAYWNGEEKPKV